MAERHEIAGPPRGEPLPRGQVGARIRIPLTGTPSPRWSQVMTARLTTALVGHPAVGHLELGSAIQGADIVLEGVEAAEAGRLGPPPMAAIQAANHDGAERGHTTRDDVNMSQEEADAIAGLTHVDYEPQVGNRPPARRFPGR